MCLSTRQFSRKLQSLTNDVPTMYLNRVKIERAKHLLKTHPEKSINDIALECAYEDASYFSKIFKQIVGLTPTQFRKNPL